jgi:hypothetical protein
MKIDTFEALIDKGKFSTGPVWRRIEHDLREAVDAVRWPPDSSHFTIYPQSGKKRGEGNGVKPIKQGFVAKLVDLGWKPEGRYQNEDKEAVVRPGAFDAQLDLTLEDMAPFVVEWETGNISSSHRAMNKMALGLLEGIVSGGILVLPTRGLYRYLTDRIGNYRELSPYFPLWSSLDVNNGYLGIVAVEHDATSLDVPRILKVTDGRALI